MQRLGSRYQTLQRSKNEDVGWHHCFLATERHIRGDEGFEFEINQKYLNAKEEILLMWQKDDVGGNEQGKPGQLLRQDNHGAGQGRPTRLRPSGLNSRVCPYCYSELSRQAQWNSCVKGREIHTYISYQCAKNIPLIYCTHTKKRFFFAFFFLRNDLAKT